MRTLIGIGILVLISYSFTFRDETWGFYGHKLINKNAIFTLPDELRPFYKSHLDYIVEHAVDPDKRRYAVRGEAIRHYIDLDHWGVDAGQNLPRNLGDAICMNAAFYYIRAKDTILIFDTNQISEKEYVYTKDLQLNTTVFKSSVNSFRLSRWINQTAIKEYDQNQWLVDITLGDSTIFPQLANAQSIWIDDKFSNHGILPYNFERVYRNLVAAWQNKNLDLVLRYSADIGHYIGDAHVPLHTTKNYNGQLTNQVGIHAFWESRVPELFAEKEFDFIIGAAHYLPDIRSHIWEVIQSSHHYVDSTLKIERELSVSFPADQQYCYEDRLGVTTKLACEKYTKEYHTKIDNQVEKRMRASIISLGSVWLSAWVDAGQPDYKEMIKKPDIVSVDSTVIPGSRFEIRDHE